MSSTLIELFTSPTCPYCPAAKRTVEETVAELNLKKKPIELGEYDTYTLEGHEKAKDYGVQVVPSIFVSGSGIKEKILIEGGPSKEELLEAIEMAEGRRKAEKKKGFWEKLFG